MRSSTIKSNGSEDQKEAFLACVGDRHLVRLCFQTLLQRSCNLSFIFDNENTHALLLL
jgi:hypothetical protein